jgi:hypothetical protein
MNRLIVLQKKSLRVLTFSRFDASSEPSFKRLKVMSLKERFVYNSLIYIFKALHSLSSINFDNYFRYKTQRPSARNENEFQLDIPFTRLMSEFVNIVRNSMSDIFNSCKLLIQLQILCLDYFIYTEESHGRIGFS